LNADAVNSYIPRVDAPSSEGLELERQKMAAADRMARADIRPVVDTGPIDGLLHKAAFPDG
jgi:hypothetical protein